ncbi:MAG TPA: serine hydrolase domain-containing protein [Solirubrobacteraceae bacterium]|nr:serine hydrolase domain-containing protein [Solirubrobacteraceae bacterium]
MRELFDYASIPVSTDDATTDAELGSGPLHDAVRVLIDGPQAPPGACLAVSHRGAVSWAAAGLAQAFDDAGPLAEPPPMSIEARTDLGSVTKVIATTSSLLALVGRGELGLERRLWEILPWARGLPAGAASLEDLLAHRAGLWEWWPLYLSATDPDAALRAAAARPLRYAPGSGRHYSDLGFQLLGGVLAAVTGRDLASAADELVLAPLGLRSTRFARPAEGAPVCASSTGDRIERRMIASGEPYPVQADPAGFGRWRTHVLVGEISDCNAFHAFGSVAGHAGLFGSARDLLRFGDALLESLDGTGPLPAATTRRFLTAGADPLQGLGFRAWPAASGDAWGHAGFPGVAVAIVPELGASIALVTNRLHVAGDPRATEAMWKIALSAAREHCAGAACA